MASFAISTKGTKQEQHICSIYRIRSIQIADASQGSATEAANDDQQVIGVCLAVAVEVGLAQGGVGDDRTEVHVHEHLGFTHLVAGGVADGTVRVQATDLKVYLTKHRRPR